VLLRRNFARSFEVDAGGFIETFEKRRSKPASLKNQGQGCGTLRGVDGLPLRHPPDFSCEKSQLEMV
jgi:hypothetical protein